MSENRSSLRLRYYRNFFLLIAVPALCVAITLLYVLRNLFLRSATDRVVQAQERVAAAMEEEIDFASLMLAHIALSNDQRGLELATQMNRAVSQHAQYANALLLQKELNTLIMPSDSFYDIHLYFRDSGFHAKQQMTKHVSAIRGSAAYRKALENPGRTVVAPVLLDDSYTVGRPYVLPVLFAPKRVSASNDVEALGLYMKTKAPALLQELSKDRQLGSILVVEDSGEIVIGMHSYEAGTYLTDYPELRGVWPLQPEKNAYRHSGGLWYASAQPIRHSQWYVFNVVERRVLLETFNRVTGTAALIILAMIGLYFLYSAWFLRDIVSPVHALSQAMESMDPVVPSELEGEFRIREFAALTDKFNAMLVQLDHLLAEVREQERAKMKAELDALQSQINPHFLSNALNSIRFTAIMARFESVQHMAEALISILQASFNRGGDHSTLAEEITVLQSYVYLMQLRYDNRFSIAFDIPAEAEKCQTPRLILQPIVENAIVHAFEDREEPGEIRVSAEVKDGCLFITVWDNGSGMDREAIDSALRARSGNRSIGLWNVDSRIRLHHGDAYGVSVDSEPGVCTQVHIRMPAIYGEEMHRLVD